ncbi:MAG TPA: DUF58 domain-containing protein [Candidatus Acidoferrum sp.]|nr:DUF58 domain-containing protein [Candidatus Acidoferrum sp.]
MNSPQNLVPSSVASRGRTARRISIAFGRRFFLLLLIGLVWIGPAWRDARFLYAMALWDVLVLAIWLWDLAQLPKARELEVRRTWTAPIQLDVESKIALEVRNLGKTSITGTIIDDVPASLRNEIPEMGIAAAASGRGGADYAIRPGERGDARLGDIALRYESAWHIGERWAAFATTQTVRVYPNLEESKRETIHLIRSRQIALEKRHQHQHGQGREFESLREYREGDEWRDVCWTATARRGKLICKTYQVERSQTVWLVLDTGRLLRARTQGLSKLDYAVNAALSLAQVALYSGDRVAVLAYGRRVRLRLPAARGASHVRAMLDGLAQLRGEELEADHLRAAESLLMFQKRRSLVVWLTDLSETATTPEVVEGAMKLAHRHLMLFTVIGQPDLRQILEERPETDREMFRYTAAQEIVHRRDVLLRTLRQQGALTLEVDPGKLSSGVVNQYLLAKERSLI